MVLLFATELVLAIWLILLLRRYRRIEVTGVKVVSLHHDISTLTGEEVVLFTLAAAPGFREKKSR